MATVGMMLCLSSSAARYAGSRKLCGPNLLKVVWGAKLGHGLEASTRLPASIYSKASGTENTKKLEPFPYKTKTLGQLRCFFERTTDRFDENSKLLVVEGSIAAGKTTMAQELAKQLDMLYIPEANLDMKYINPYGYDLRDYNHLIPDTVRPYDIKDFYNNPNHMNAFTFQVLMYKLRFEQYIDAIAHILNTGQGVVMDRCVYSDFCFLETMAKFGYVSRNAKEYYYKLKANTIGELMKPHMVIYLDVPVDIIKERIKKRGLQHEVNSKVLTTEYLQTLEENYKYKYLKQIGNHAELLIYDWREFGDVEVVVEDLERVQFIEEDNHDPKFEDWRVLLEEEWKEKRMYYTREKDHIMTYFNLPAFDVPEFFADTPDWAAYYAAYDKVPGNKYSPGFNADMGDKNILFKVK